MTTRRPVSASPKDEPTRDPPVATTLPVDTQDQPASHSNPVEATLPPDDYFDTPYITRISRAGYGKFEAKQPGVVPIEEFDTFDFRTPRDDTSIPRHIREMEYAHLEDAIRHMSVPVEVQVTTHELRRFELPPKHRLSGKAMQKLMFALMEFRDGRGELPDWHDFEDISPQPASQAVAQEADAVEKTPEELAEELAEMIREATTPPTDQVQVE